MRPFFLEPMKSASDTICQNFIFQLHLEKAALGHSIDMVRYNFYAHNSPVPGQADMTDRR
jgi:hypothetical protein